MKWGAIIGGIAALVVMLVEVASWAGAVSTDAERLAAKAEIERESVNTFRAFRHMIKREDLYNQRSFYQELLRHLTISTAKRPAVETTRQRTSIEQKLLTIEEALRAMP